MSEYSELRERKRQLLVEKDGLRMAIGKLHEWKRETPRTDEDLRSQIDDQIIINKDDILKINEQLIEINNEFERITREAAERRARKARRQE